MAAGTAEAGTTWAFGALPSQPKTHAYLLTPPKLKY